MMVIINCSGTPAPGPEQEARVRDSVVALLREGDVDGARAVVERAESTGNVTVVPLGPDDVALREADAVEAVRIAIEGRRAERNALLAASDWRVLPDAPPDGYDAWVSYRQALRDIDFTADVVFPAPPEAP